MGYISDTAIQQTNFKHIIQYTMLHTYKIATCVAAHANIHTKWPLASLCVRTNIHKHQRVRRIILRLATPMCPMQTSPLCIDLSVYRDQGLTERNGYWVEGGA